jgi:hypothetical protein
MFEKHIYCLTKMLEKKEKKKIIYIDELNKKCLRIV